MHNDMVILKGSYQSDFKIILSACTELAEVMSKAGLQIKKGSFPNGPGFDKLNLTAFIIQDKMSNWY